MTCPTRWAEAWQYSLFWCSETLLVGADDSGLPPGQPSLQCSYIDFQQRGVEANVGMICYNTTQNTSGVITSVSGNTLTVSGVTWGNTDAFRIVTLDASTRGAIENFLNLTAPDINAMLGSIGACDCTLASWASAYLGKLNIIEAGIFYHCPCGAPSLSEEEKRLFLDFINKQSELILTGKVELCAGYTGADFPAVGIAQMSVTEFAAARIIYNDMLRNMP